MVLLVFQISKVVLACNTEEGIKCGQNGGRGYSQHYRGFAMAKFDTVCIRNGCYTHPRMPSYGGLRL
jgi:hypothetical protein